MYEFMERSMVVSSRVDARALATIAKWMQQNGQYVKSKSAVVSYAIKMVAASVTNQQPEMAINTMEEAYNELVRHGLAPVSAQANRAMGRAMGVEQQLNGSDGLADLGMVQKMATRMYAGQGYARDELQTKVSNTMADVVNHANQQQAEAEAIDPFELDDDDMHRQALEMMMQRESPERVAEWEHQWLADKPERIAKAKATRQQDQQEAQAARTAQAIEDNQNNKVEKEELTFEQRKAKLTTGLAKSWRTNVIERPKKQQWDMPRFLVEVKVVTDHLGWEPTSEELMDWLDEIKELAELEHEKRSATSVTHSLDATDPNFMKDYEKRDKARKAAEKAALSGPPS